jgi:hypothetical protein
MLTTLGSIPVLVLSVLLGTKWCYRKRATSRKTDQGQPEFAPPLIRGGERWRPGAQAITCKVLGFEAPET